MTISKYKLSCIKWLITILLSFNMLCLIVAKTKYFNLGTYYLFLILVAGFSFLYIVITKFRFRIGISQLVVHTAPLVVIFLSYFLNPYDDAFKAYLLTFTVLFLLCMVDFSKHQIDFLTKSYIISAVIFSIVMLIQHKLPYAEYGILRYGIYFGENKFYDINFTAAYILVPNLIAFCRFIDGNKRYLLLWLLTTIPIIMTGSRGAIVPMILFIVYKLYKLFKLGIDRSISFRYIISFGIFVLVLLFFIPREILQRLFVQSYVNDGSNVKRLMEWRLAFNVFSERPFIGHGMIATTRLLSQIKQGTTAHNSLGVYLINFGIVGTIAFMTQMFQIIANLRKNIKDYAMIYYAWLFSMFMIEATLSLVFVIPMIYFLIVSNQQLDKNINDELEGNVK